jgi:hypothetical protein
VQNTKEPLEITYRGYSFVVSDYGDRGARFGVHGQKLGISDKPAPIHGDQMMLTRCGAIRWACRRIDRLLAGTP